MSMLTQIESKLKQGMRLSHLEVINESHMHSRGEESHFKVIAVSDEFEGKRLLQCHRMINGILADELAHHIHALAIHTYTPAQWQEASVPDSPTCLGGSKFDK